MSSRAVTTKPVHRCAVPRAALLGCCIGLSAAFAGRSPEETSRDRAEAEALFTNGVVLHLRIEIPKEGLESLRKEPRKYVKATLREGDQAFPEVGLHLKGSIGSFRQVDDKPGMTLNLDTFLPEPRRFHGLRKFHLNNSVQDPTYLSELICGELFRAAGVPAPRVAHALVELNGRKLGLYTLLESMEKEFFSLYFRKTGGNLYGQPGHGEVTDNLHRMEGKGPLDRGDLKALAAAVQEPDALRRYERLRQTLDVDRFLSFMALEILLCHWDGYTFARHNFRVYHDLDTDRMVFLPHDKDQMLGDPNLPILPGVNGLVAQAIVKTPETRRQYLQRFGFIFTNYFVLPALTNRVDELVARIAPVLTNHNPQLARDFVNHARGLKERIVNRRLALEKRFNQPPPNALKFENGVARLRDWLPVNERGGAQLERPPDKDGQPTLWIRATAESAASWRCKVLLAGGRYRFEGDARAAGIVPLPDDPKGQGAGLRISGSDKPRPNQLVGDAPTQRLAYEFDAAAPDEEIELVCELRARRGEVWFLADSLRLVRLK